MISLDHFTLQGDPRSRRFYFDSESAHSLDKSEVRDQSLNLVTMIERRKNGKKADVVQLKSQREQS